MAAMDSELATDNFRVLETKQVWNGMQLKRYDFMMTDEATAGDQGTGNVIVLVSARRGCRPCVKWVWCGTRRKGWASAAYGWLKDSFGTSLRVSGVEGAESIGFHRAMKSKGIVHAYSGL